MKIKNFLKFSLRELFLAGHIFSLGGVAVAVSFMVILHLEVYWPLAFSIYLFGQPIFFIDRYLGISEDRKDNPIRTKHIEVYHKFIPVFVLVYMILFFIWMFYWGMYENMYMGLLLFILGAVYRWAFKEITRKVLGFKNVFVAFFWILFGFYVLLFYKSASVNDAFILFSIYIFIRSFMIQIFMDIKDQNSDGNNNLKTFILVYGKRATFQLLTVLNILSVVTLCIGVFGGIFPYTILLLSLVSISFQFLMSKVYQKFSYKYLLIETLEYIVILGLLSIAYGIVQFY